MRLALMSHEALALATKSQVYGWMRGPVPRHELPGVLADLLNMDDEGSRTREQMNTSVDNIQALHGLAEPEWALAGVPREELGALLPARGWATARMGKCIAILVPMPGGWRLAPERSPA